jgi:hypothetical protein
VDTGRRPTAHRRIVLSARSRPKSDDALAGLAARYRAECDEGRLTRFARGLGLSVACLRRLGVGWCEESRAYSFPMLDAAARVVGIRLRTPKGRKFAVRGGHEGFFLPDDLDAPGLLLVCEGPTDTAAMPDLGLQAVGRPSCSGGSSLLVDLIGLHRPDEVAIVADRDRPGREGASALVQRLVIHAGRLRVVTPPAGVKDARAWVQSGATRADVLDVIRSAEVHRLTVRARATSSPAGAGGRAHVS